MKPYPFSTVLEAMKPSKPNMNKPSHRKRMHDIMRSDRYVFEEKIDGISILSIGGRLFTPRISVVTGQPSEKTDHVPHISNPLRARSGKLILDGELYYPYKKSNHVTSIANSSVEVALQKQATKAICSPDDNPLMPSFVVNQEKETYEPGYLRYVVYDVLRDIEGNWLIEEPFEKRRAILESLFEGPLSGLEFVDLNAVHYDNFQARLDKILEAGGEGAVLKSKDGKYYPGKRPMWNQVKLKQEMEDDVVIIGFAPPTRLYTGENVENWPYWEEDPVTGESVPVTEHYYRGLIGSIRIGKYDSNGELVDMGSVTGITDSLRRELTENQERFIGSVIKIKAMEMSEHGVYRHANFLDWHPDKPAHQCKVNENDK